MRDGLRGGEQQGEGREPEPWLVCKMNKILKIIKWGKHRTRARSLAALVGFTSEKNKIK